jgi:hypothetical protein
MRAWQKEMMANREAAEANAYEMKSIMVHEEVPREHAAVKPVTGEGSSIGAGI